MHITEEPQNERICKAKKFVDDSRRRGTPHKSWRDNIAEWTSLSLSSLLGIADDRSRWATIAAEASAGVRQRRLGVMRVSPLPTSCLTYITLLLDLTENS